MTSRSGRAKNYSPQTEHGGKPVIGARPYALLQWQGLKVGVQICADSAEKVPECDIYLLVGDNTGQTLLRERPGGISVYVDACRRYLVRDAYQTHNERSGMNCFELSLAWRYQRVAF